MDARVDDTDVTTCGALFDRPVTSPADFELDLTISRT
jgi:hypothetical protein